MDHLNLEHEAKLARSPPRSMASTPGRSRRSVFGESFHSWDSEHSMTLSRAGSRARSYAQRSARSERSDLAQAEKEMMWDSSLHLVNRREPWNSSARGLQTAWGAHTSYDLLRFDLEPHPSWVAKAPGVYGEHFDRNLLPTPPPRALFRSSWDPRFVMHNHISSDPVLDGNRLGLNNRRGVPVSFASPTRNYAKR